jgi:SAM-dependent methyltransferase
VPDEDYGLPRLAAVYDDLDPDRTDLEPYLALAEELQVDLTTMTANVAQVFLTDEAWAATLEGIRAALAPGGHLVFETRDPGRRAWEDWTPERTRQQVEVPEVGLVESWTEVLEVDGAYVTFRHTHVFHADGETVPSTSTLRFRSREELDASLEEAGFEVLDVRDAPDRPGLELVYVARTRTVTPPSSTTSPSRS